MVKFSKYFVSLTSRDHIIISVSNSILIQANDIELSARVDSGNCLVTLEL